ncbi:uncharacterized protein TNCV_1074031 [Trichonephila clavipes]|uniref:Uncharacterized protein n=1 Tax=Trichonephila clavipes TaxID=2585209 RepID=A0A8X6SU06_TRICX|nr:uncharacterized protein TNCV_1074031 [Trichonephila clavipes]
MIKFIDFCKAWFLPKSVARVAAIAGDHRSATRLGIDLKTLWMCSSGYSRLRSFHALTKLIWCGSWGCSLGQSLINHGPIVFYLRKIRRASEPRKQFNLVINEEPLNNAYHVWLHIILLKYVCGQAVKVRKDNWLQQM